jgi:toxin CptA
MNNKMKPIRLDFKPSITLTLIICAMGVSTVLILILPALIWQIKLLFGICILTAVIYTVCQYGLLLLPWSCLALNINSSNQVQLVYRNGKVLSVDVCRDSLVTPYLTVVNCKVQVANLFAQLFSPHLVILPDMLEAEAYRQLRVWLRWGKPTHT